MVQAHGAQADLTLLIEETVAASLAAFLAERALIQVEIGEDGSQRCRARYYLGKIQAPHVDVELPLPVSRLRDRPSFALGKRALDQWTVIDGRANVVRVKLHPDLVSLPAVLEIQYTVPPDALEPVSGWKTTLHPPVFRSEVAIGQMRWQVNLPRPVIAASLEQQVRADIKWTLQGWLPTPETATSSADLEAWLTGKESGQNPAPVTFAFTLLSQQPATIYFFPRWGWWLGCSGLLLVLTLGTYFSPLSRVGFGLVVLLLGVGLLVLAILCPAAIAPVLFGIQPGVVLFLAFAGAHWFVQERYRRQLVFMTGFTRAKPASTLVRNSAAAKRPREGSTIDAPEKAASSPSGTSAGT